MKLGYVDQSRDSLNPNHNVWDEFRMAPMLSTSASVPASRAYVSSFGFKGPDQQKEGWYGLSGERNRVHMAKMLKSGARMFFCSMELSNDLDIETLRLKMP